MIPLNSKGLIPCDPLCPWLLVFCSVSWVFEPWHPNSLRHWIPCNSNTLVMSRADVDADLKDTGGLVSHEAESPWHIAVLPAFPPFREEPSCTVCLSRLQSPFPEQKNTQTYKYPPAHTAERFCLLLSPYSVHLPPPVGPAYSPPLASLTWISSVNTRRLSASTLSLLQALLHSTGKLMLQHADKVRSMSLMNSLQRLKMKLLSKDPDHTSPYDLSGLCPPLLSSPLLCIPAALVFQSFKISCFLPSLRFAQAVPLSGNVPHSHLTNLQIQWSL